MKEVAARLKSCSRGGEIAVRLAEPYALADGQASMAGRIGIARYPTDGGSLETLLAKSDKALYAATRADKNRTVFAANGKFVVPKPVGRVM